MIKIENEKDDEDFAVDGNVSRTSCKMWQIFGRRRGLMRSVETKREKA